MMVLSDVQYVIVKASYGTRLQQSRWRWIHYKITMYWCISETNLCVFQDLQHLHWDSSWGRAEFWGCRGRGQTDRVLWLSLGVLGSVLSGKAHIHCITSEKNVRWKEIPNKMIIAQTRSASHIHFEVRRHDATVSSISTVYVWSAKLTYACIWRLWVPNSQEKG